MGLFTKSPGDYNPEPKPYNADRPLRASAQVIKLDTRTEIESFSRNTAKSRSTDSWQSAAWDYYDEVGEVKYSFGVTASTVSRIRIYPGVVVDPARPPQHVNDTEGLPEGLAEAAMRGMKLLASGPGGIPTLMSALALNLQVAGECYLVQIPERAGAGIPETWAIYSTDSIVVDQNGTVAIRARKEDRIQDYIVLPKTAFVARIWKAHPRYPGDPDSSMRGLLGPLEELMLLNRTLRATARSRLNAGMLYLPDGLSLARAEATPFTDDGDPTTSPDGLPGGTNDDEDEFEVELMEAMTTPIQDEDSASAVVPLIVRGPAELGEKIKIFSFARSFDAALTAEREATLDRVLSGLDIPKEMVKGLAEIKYSNAVVIDDQYFRSNVEPLTLGMVDALTTVFMRQYLVALGFSRSDAERVVIWYDPADVVVRPNRNEDATQGYDRYILSEEAWRRTHGFSEADKPAPDEIIRRLVVSKGQLPDALTEALLHWIAPQVLEAARAGNPQAAENIPPEVAQALGQPPSQAPAEPAAPEPTPFEDQSPTPPPGAPAPPTSRPRNPDEPITAPPRPAA